MYKLLTTGNIKHLIVTVNVPVRVCDISGWADIKAAAHGTVSNMSVLCRQFGSSTNYRGVDSTVTAKLSLDERVISLLAPDIDVKYTQTGNSLKWDTKELLGAIMASATPYFPEGIDLEIKATSNGIPPGGSVGTSAAISVAIISAVEYLSRESIDPNWVARTAHEVETLVMGIECGVQDQCASAHSCGAGHVDISHYPNCTMQQIPLRQDVIDEIEKRLITVVYGSPHRSSDVHKSVIAGLREEGRLAARLEAFRVLPAEARYCLLKGDMAGYGMVMCRNTEAQRSLHEDLISADCQGIIDIAKRSTALGWKVNGAGGPDGGSLTILCGDKSKAEVVSEIKAVFPSLFIMEHKLAQGGVKVSVKTE